MNIKWKYSLIENKENSSKIELDDIILSNEIKGDESIEYKGEGPFKFYLHLIIEPQSEEKKEKENEKNIENNEIKATISNLEQISNELSDIRKQMRNIKRNFRNIKNIRYEQKEMFNFIKHNLYVHKKMMNNEKNLNPKTMVENYNQNITNINQPEQKSLTNIIYEKKDSNEINPDTYINASNSSVIYENQEYNNCKIFFLVSSPIREKKSFLKEDFSYYEQFLKIYDIIKNLEDISVDLHLKQIEDSLYMNKNPDILHLRIDSNFEENRVDKNTKIKEYSLDDFVEIFDKIKDLKLLIFSSQNIKEIKKKLDEKKNLKAINKIYIEHSKEAEEKENEFIEKLYYNMLNDEKTIKNSIPEINNIIFFHDIEDDIECFEKRNKSIDPEFLILNREEKYILNFEKVKNDYCLIGRSEELYQCLKKFSNDYKICVYGTKGVGKKSFAKKVGFSSYERNIFNKVYFLEINSLDNINPELKINMLIDEICEYNCKYTYEINVLLIIYFEEVICKIDDLKKIISKNDVSKRNHINISYLYTFTLDDDKDKENIKVFKNPIELTHFKFYGKEEIKDSNFKELFNFCMERKNINDKEKFIENLINILESGEKCKGAKINNIFLIVSYISFLENKIVNNNDLNKILHELILKDDEKIKKQIISEIIEEEKAKKIFLYMNKLNSGAGKSLLKILLDDRKEKIINYIQEKLFGLIVVENNGTEDIFRLDSSFQALIEEIINEKNYYNNNKQIELNILQKYFNLFRLLLKDYINEKEGFHACIQNNFWFSEEAEKAQKDFLDEENYYILNSEIDSINIYNIINDIKNEEYNNKNLQIYIDDISISLPSLLYFTNNIYYEYLIISFFENFFGNLKDNENAIKINGLILRLGIFKYWVSKIPNFFEKSLELADLLDENNINSFNHDVKFEYYLSKIYNCYIKKDKNIEIFSYECKRILNDEKKEKENKKINEINEINEERLYNLCYQVLNKIDHNSKNSFYFFLQNPLEKEFKIETNRNFYLIQKLRTILPLSYGVEFKTLEDKEGFKDYLKENKNILNNIKFLYIANETLKDLFFEFITKEKINIKILIFGDFPLNIDDALKKLKDQSIKNIIYVSRNNSNLESSFYGNTFEYYFEIYYIEFIHEFISLITSKYNYCSITKAFNRAKRNFVSKFVEILEYKESILDKMINLESKIEDDTFENDYIEEGENINNSRKIINDIDDEYEYNQIKNIYYRKNPFSESNEKKLKKSKFIKFMKLPGIDYLNPKNFSDFIEKGIYDLDNITQESLQNILDSIENNNIINIYGKNLVFYLADELCKYYYLAGKFKSGIYIVFPRNIEEELDSLIENIELNKKKDDDNTNNILIVFKSLNMKDEESDIKISIQHLKGLKIIICSETESNMNGVKKFPLNLKNN